MLAPLAAGLAQVAFRPDARLPMTVDGWTTGQTWERLVPSLIGERVDRPLGARGPQARVAEAQRGRCSGIALGRLDPVAYSSRAAGRTPSASASFFRTVMVGLRAPFSTPLR